VTTVRLPAAPSSAALVRHHIAADLALSAVAPAIIEDVALVATELVTNAIRHADPLPGGQVIVAWQLGQRAVTVRVSDGGATSAPRIRHPSPKDTSGRGLALVEAIATRWGIEDGAGSTTVWAELAF
jgi:anti-sigma regulatory factor (Ser/Thr protein kinase)